MEKLWFKSYQKYGIKPDIQLPKDESSLVDFLENSLRDFATRDAYIFMDKRITFAQLDAMSIQFAAYLQSLGLNKGARVAVMMPNVMQYPIVTAAVLRAGYILVNVNPLYTSRELEHQLTDSGAEVLIILENFATTFQAIAAKSKIKKVIIAAVGDMLGLLKGTLVNVVLRRVKKVVPAWRLPGHIRFNEALSAGKHLQYTRPKVVLSDTAVLQYTGGTTGLSKGAELTHRNLMANLIQTDSLFETVMSNDARPNMIICALPLYHIFAFTVCYLYGIQRGSVNLLIPNPRDIPALTKEFAKYQPNLFPAVNTLFNALLNYAPFRALDFSALKLTMGGGMSVLEATATEWKKVTGGIIVEGYGLSETSPIATANPPNTESFSGTIGFPLPATDVLILDDAGKAVELGQPGEISIRGPQVMKGYWNRPDATSEVMTADGYFRTGDVGVMDERGFIKIVDRKKDMILVSGFNVYPNELEAVVAQHPKVLEVAAIGVPDAKSGEVPKLFIVKKDPSLTEAEILALCHEQLTGYKQPKYIEFIAELPKSNVGKILRRELRPK